jgi:hypothetical protein
MSLVSKDTVCTTVIQHDKRADDESDEDREKMN